MKDPMVAPTEAEFTAQIIQYAQLKGWRTLHLRPAMSSSGRWATHVQGDGVGFPDLLLLRGDRLVIAELKVGRGKLTAEQGAWLDAFGEAVAGVYVWRPSDWDHIEDTLR